jgi:hypothetical protein
VNVRIGNYAISAWRTADLESAKNEAASEHKPIAWIASDPKFLDGTGKISTDGSRGATLHALYALREGKAGTRKSFRIFTFIACYFLRR